MASIFISYRHSDAAGHAGRLYDKFAERFGEANVFKDLDSLEPGANFAEVIEDTISRCDALIAVIGKDWLAPNPDGSSRLKSRNDWVRLELVAALSRKLRIVPALVGGATLPKAGELPQVLRPLTKHHAVVLSEDVWPLQVTQMLDRLERAIAKDDRARKLKILADALPDQPVRIRRTKDQPKRVITPRVPVRPRPWGVEVRKASGRTRVLDVRRGRAKHEVTVRDGRWGSPAARVTLDGETQIPRSPGQRLSADPSFAQFRLPLTSPSGASFARLVLKTDRNTGRMDWLYLSIGGKRLYVEGDPPEMTR